MCYAHMGGRGLGREEYTGSRDSGTMNEKKIHRVAFHTDVGRALRVFAIRFTRTVIVCAYTPGLSEKPIPFRGLRRHGPTAFTLRVRLGVCIVCARRPAVARR